MGIDVGGPRKGLHTALIDGRRLLELDSRLAREAVVESVHRWRPTVIAIDSPRACAAGGQRSRDCERLLARAICSIRWTPDRDRVEAGSYYAWIREGLGLFAALSAFDAELIEVFPTASWTRWAGPRGRASRSTWSRCALARLALEALPRRTNQDQRDAIAAAVTACQHSRGETEAIGQIVVPRGSRERPRSRRGSGS
jgi:predicted nuclease with RNAse H fold